MARKDSQPSGGEKGPGLAGSMGRGGTGENAERGLSESLGRRSNGSHGTDTDLQSSLGRKGKK